MWSLWGSSIMFTPSSKNHQILTMSKTIKCSFATHLLPASLLQPTVLKRGPRVKSLHDVWWWRGGLWKVLTACTPPTHPSLLRHGVCDLCWSFNKLENVSISWPVSDPAGAETITMHQRAEVLIHSGRTKGEGQWSNNSYCWAAARDTDTFPGWFTLAGSR